jgi:YD repeat-containing protein
MRVTRLETTQQGKRTMTSVGRFAVYAMLALGAAWPCGASAQTTLTRTSSFAYDPASGLLIQEVIEPNTPSLLLQTDYSYDSFGNKTQVMVSGVDIATRSSSTTYDTQGQFVIQKANALQQKEFWVYDPKFGKPLSHTGPNGVITTWQYDAFGRKTLEQRAVNTPSMTQTKFTYTQCSGCIPNGTYYVFAIPLDANNNVNGARTWTWFDALDRETYRCTDAFDGSPICIQTVYDGLGRVLKKTRPYFWFGGTLQWTTYAYDALGRVITETLPDNNTIRHAYHGLVTTDTNQNNQTRTVTKNSQGQVISVADALSNVTTYYYDAFGNLLQTVDATGKNVVTATYDPRGRKTASSDPDLGTWTYTYDVLSQLKSQTDAIGQVPPGQPPSGRVTNFTYDLLGRLIQRDEFSQANVLDMTAVWTYGTVAPAIGRLVSATATGPAAGGGPAYQRSMTYDSLSRPQQVTSTIDGASYTISGAYDLNGRLSGVTYPSQSNLAVNYSYNSLG